MAVLAKAGCNAGGCHGNKNGKAGFKLSLRGQDPDADYQVLTRDAFGRRINIFEPEESLLLLKPTTKVAHEGGLRFKKDSEEYAILSQWIAAGAPRDPVATPEVKSLQVTPLERVLIEPADHVQLKVRAIFSDGTERDITSRAVYEPANTLAKASHDGLVTAQGQGEVTVLVRYLQLQVPVRLAFIPARPNFKWCGARPNNFVDGQIFSKLRSLRINPSELCTDTVFLRRAYLDLLGVLPTPDEAKAFVADRHRDKRAKLVDQLLERPEFADFWALKWADLLRAEEKSLDRKGVQNFHHWIRQCIAENMPLDQFAREIISARGSTYTSPAANYYRALRTPVARAESTAQVFLGTRLLCAQCHNHPYDRWTQDDYYGWASVFARVNYKVLENKRNDGLDTHEFNGDQIVFIAREGDVTNARTGKPAAPRFLGAAQILEPAGVPDETDRLDALAAWLTSPANERFAKSQVNRIWFHLMGRGIVDPIDDFRPTNPPSHPALLDALAADFVKHNYDLRHLIRVIMNARAYQLSPEPNDSNRADEVNYSHALPRRLGAEQLLDAEHQVTGVTTHFAGYPAGLRAGQLPGVAALPRKEMRHADAEKFLAIFGKPQRLLTCECERSGETTMGQAFQLISGPSINDLLTTPDNRLGQLIASNKSNDQVLDDLYWSALSRPPTTAERSRMIEYLSRAKDRRQALEDLAWGLLNAKEFVLRE
ncbi:MAG TPA: DUF1549 and DUF1553 domain-containing protein [Verrucomicrobiae bacterium]|nr:DUF1549 and DUF1553 domain-containing protein [Verrucomicrobiae bacterium]